MIRKIKFITTNGGSGTVETSARTLEELMPLLRSNNIEPEGMKLIVGETRNELSQPGAILPTGDFKLFVVPHKTKAGGIKKDIKKILLLLEGLTPRVSEFSTAKSTTEIVTEVVDLEYLRDQEELDELMSENTTWGQ